VTTIEYLGIMWYKSTNKEVPECIKEAKRKEWKDGQVAKLLNIVEWIIKEQAERQARVFSNRV
jgi:hypothetical protein